MKKIIDSLKFVRLSDLFSPFIFILLIIPSLFFRLFNKILKRDLWLICENGETARDNGYHFFKYIRTTYPNDYCFYVIDKKKSDYEKIKQYGNVIQFKSIKHWIYYLSAKYNISNQKNGNPNQVLFYILHVTLGLFKNRVFLQHGITKDDSPWIYYKNTKFKYFICGAKDEYNYIKEKFGYPEKNVIYTGFPRFDNLYDNKVDNKQILIMPTWRGWLGRDRNSLSDKIDFVNTDYYKNWNGFLNYKNFVEYVEKNNFTVYFYPHFNMKNYLNDFKIKSNNIKIVDNSIIDIQKLLKESSILITDYSSVYMDFAYMLKPVLYFQFDAKEYRQKHLQQGYYDYDRDGFGPVVDNKKELFDEFLSIVEHGTKKMYTTRMKNFFEIKDQNNCSRIYDVLKKG